MKFISILNSLCEELKKICFKVSFYKDNSAATNGGIFSYSNGTALGNASALSNGTTYNKNTSPTYVAKISLLLAKAVVSVFLLVFMTVPILVSFPASTLAADTNTDGFDVVLEFEEATYDTREDKNFTLIFNPADATIIDLTIQKIFTAPGQPVSPPTDLNYTTFNANALVELYTDPNHSTILNLKNELNSTGTYELIFTITTDADPGPNTFTETVTVQVNDFCAVRLDYAIIHGEDEEEVTTPFDDSGAVVGDYYQKYVLKDEDAVNDELTIEVSLHNYDGRTTWSGEISANFYDEVSSDFPLSLNDANTFKARITVPNNQTNTFPRFISDISNTGLITNDVLFEISTLNCTYTLSDSDVPTQSNQFTSVGADPITTLSSQGFAVYPDYEKLESVELVYSQEKMDTPIADQKVIIADSHDEFEFKPIHNYLYNEDDENDSIPYSVDEGLDFYNETTTAHTLTISHDPNEEPSTFSDNCPTDTELTTPCINTQRSAFVIPAGYFTIPGTYTITSSFTDEAPNTFTSQNFTLIVTGGIIVNSYLDLEDNGIEDDDVLLCDSLAEPGEQCTLRAAIQTANASSTPVSIVFDSDTFGAQRTIFIKSDLPAITKEGLIIDGFINSIFSNRKITISSIVPHENLSINPANNGEQMYNGFKLGDDAANVEIRNINFNNLNKAIIIETDNNTLEDLEFGEIDTSYSNYFLSLDRGNNYDLLLNNASGNLISSSTFNTARIQSIVLDDSTDNSFVSNTIYADMTPINLKNNSNNNIFGSTNGFNEELANEFVLTNGGPAIQLDSSSRENYVGHNNYILAEGLSTDLPLFDIDYDLDADEDEFSYYSNNETLSAPTISASYSADTLNITVRGTGDADTDYDVHLMFTYPEFKGLDFAELGSRSNFSINSSDETLMQTVATDDNGNFEKVFEIENLTDFLIAKICPVLDNNDDFENIICLNSVLESGYTAYFTKNDNGYATSETTPIQSLDNLLRSTYEIPDNPYCLNIGFVCHLPYSAIKVEYKDATTATVTVDKMMIKKVFGGLVGFELIDNTLLANSEEEEDRLAKIKDSTYLLKFNEAKTSTSLYDATIKNEFTDNDDAISDYMLNFFNESYSEVENDRYYTFEITDLVGLDNDANRYALNPKSFMHSAFDICNTEDTDGSVYNCIENLGLDLNLEEVNLTNNLELYYQMISLTSPLNLYPYPKTIVNNYIKFTDSSYSQTVENVQVGNKIYIEFLQSFRANNSQNAETLELTVLATDSQDTTLDTAITLCTENDDTGVFRCSFDTSSSATTLGDGTLTLAKDNIVKIETQIESLDGEIIIDNFNSLTGLYTGANDSITGLTLSGISNVNKFCTARKLRDLSDFSYNYGAWDLAHAIKIGNNEIEALELSADSFTDNKIAVNEPFAYTHLNKIYNGIKTLSEDGVVYTGYESDCFDFVESVQGTLQIVQDIIKNENITLPEDLVDLNNETPDASTIIQYLTMLKNGCPGGNCGGFTWDGVATEFEGIDLNQANSLYNAVKGSSNPDHATMFTFLLDALADYGFNTYYIATEKLPEKEFFNIINIMPYNSITADVLLNIDIEDYLETMMLYNFMLPNYYLENNNFAFDFAIGNNMQSAIKPFSLNGQEFSNIPKDEDEDEDAVEASIYFGLTTNSFRGSNMFTITGAKLLDASLNKTTVFKGEDLFGDNGVSIGSAKNSTLFNNLSLYFNAVNEDTDLTVNSFRILTGSKPNIQLTATTPPTTCLNPPCGGNGSNDKVTADFTTKQSRNLIKPTNQQVCINIQNTSTSSNKNGFDKSVWTITNQNGVNVFSQTNTSPANANITPCFTIAGKYNVSLSISGKDGKDTKIENEYITVINYDGPTSEFCDLYPNDPECDNEPVDESCDLYPSAPECNNETSNFCRKNPSHPTCKNRGSAEDTDSSTEIFKEILPEIETVPQTLPRFTCKLMADLSNATLDSDNDGLADLLERAIGTDPFIANATDMLKWKLASGSINCEVPNLDDSQKIILHLESPKFKTAEMLLIPGTIILQNLDLDDERKIYFTLRDTDGYSTYLGAYTDVELSSLDERTKFGDFILRNTKFLLPGIYELIAYTRLSDGRIISTKTMIEIDPTLELIDLALLGFSKTPASRLANVVENGVIKYKASIRAGSKNKLITLQSKPGVIANAYYNSILVSSSVLSDNSGIILLSIPDWVSLNKGDKHTLTVQTFDPMTPELKSNIVVVDFKVTMSLLELLLYILAATLIIGGGVKYYRNKKLNLQTSVAVPEIQQI